MLKKILIGVGILAGIVVLLVIVVAMQPSEFQVTRSATLPAAPEAVFPHVNDLRQWDAWSPWAKLDPQAKNSFAGPSEGKGASFTWSGNDKVGEGTMTITESRPPELVRMKLEFVRPFEDTSDTEFKFEPQGNETLLTWTMSGRQNFIGKAMCMFMDMDAMIGGDFEEGLANLKEVVEAEAAESNLPADNADES